jgi:hypothetical protein
VAQDENPLALAKQRTKRAEPYPKVSGFAE